MTAVCALALSTACESGIEEAPQVMTADQALRSYNARAWNARAWNARAWNARAYNGTAWNDAGALNAKNYDNKGYTVVGFDGRTFTKKELKQVGSYLRITGKENDSLGGGFTISTNEPGAPLNIRFTGPIALVQNGVPTDIQTYMVDVDDGDGFVPLYENDAGVALASIPLLGYWDSSEASQGTINGGAWSDDHMITLAARTYVLAKCVELGYKPWVSGPTNSDKLHRSCVRMLRADYCGDGNTWTQDGTLLNVYDRAAIQVRETAQPYPGDATKDWVFEAAWGPSGAVCVASHRIQSLTPMCGAQTVEERYADPACITAIQPISGGVAVNNVDAYLMSERVSF